MRWRATKEYVRFKYAPRIANGFIALSTYRARSMLRRNGPISLLIDNTVLGHGITPETAWISTGVKKWGSQDIQTGHLARIPVHAAKANSREHQNIRYLPGIARLARQGLILLKTSSELEAEKDRQPIGRFSGYGWFDFNLFRNVPIESVDGFVLPTMRSLGRRAPDAAEEQRIRLDNSDDPLYRSLVQRLGPANSQDAWHIRTAEVHSMFCFLTMDFGLLRTVAALRNLEPLKSLRTRVMTPLELGRHFGLVPVPTHLLSYNDASFPVRSDLSSPDGKRRPRKFYRKG